MSRIAEADVKRFETEGAILVKSVIPQELLARLSSAADKFLSAEKGMMGEPNYFKRLGLHARDEAFHEVCFKSAVPALAAQLLRSDRVNLLYDQLFVKEGGNPAPTPWHNDLPYWPLLGTGVLTVWVGLDRITLENGGLEFISGSHAWKQWYRPFYSDNDGRVTKHFYAGDDTDKIYAEMPDFTREREKHKIIAFDMDPGDALVFHSLTMHGAPGNNRKDMKRRGYAIRMTGDDVRYRSGPVWNQDLVSKTLKTGERLDGPQFPVVWPRAA